MTLPTRTTALATLLLAPLLLLGVRARAAEPAPAKKDKPAVAVIYFDYDGKNEELAVLKKGLAQMLISDLSHLDNVAMIERLRLQEVIDELELGKSKKIDPATAAKVGKLLGARYMVLGGYFELMNTLRVDARVVEVETGKVIRSVGASGKSDDFLTIELKVAEDLEKVLTSEAFGASAAPEVAPPPVKRPKALKAKTAVKYSKALDAMDRGDKETAKKELKDVVAEAPDFTLATADLDGLLQ
ncbi:MAG: hypothetical protein KC635_22420 [Myxococcales bacterium]|nr:hypothetical protein [Myxococcales bacterium]MCB9733745.1 hypothetical protein [Deltaproteobacteria bacterium]